MPYSSVAIANHFIMAGLEEDAPITPMKAQKLVYIAHGWYLGNTGNPLISDTVQAWEYGPVIPILYHEAKIFKNRPIDSAISLWDGQEEEARHPWINRANPVSKYLDNIWSAYKSLSAGQLSTLTHQKGTPWWIVYHDRDGKNRRNVEIPNQLIEDHYRAKVAKLRSSQDVRQ